MLLKEVYDKVFLKNLCDAILPFDKNFDEKGFFSISNLTWNDKALKERMRAISINLDKYLSPKTYQEKTNILKKAAEAIPKGKNSGLALIIFADFVEIFGCDDFDFSMNALEFFTEYGSSEFAVRQYLKIDEDRALGFFVKWSKSKNYHVRRLASEGCRSRLTWGCALESFKKDPTKILPILQELKFDDSDYVRKSVANNLNDISKDNPDVVLKLLQGWKKEKVAENLISHGLRTLLKKGNSQALKLIGVDHKNNDNIKLKEFKLDKKELCIGDDLTFDFIIESKDLDQKIRLEYAISFLKKSGSHGKKVFQISCKKHDKNEIRIVKKHNFRDLSTRIHNVGEHFIAIIINGEERYNLEFLLKKSL